MLKNLSDLGMGKKESMEVSIMRDAEVMVQSLVEKDGQTVQAKVGHDFLLCPAYVNL